MYDIIIIGAGPAGISAGIYARRAGANVLILYYGESNLEKASKIDNYYGFKEGISGKELYQEGIEQAKNLGIEVENEEVVNIQKQDEGFNVNTVSQIYKSKVVIIATGNKKLRPNIKGIAEYEGKGISYCAICDGFFYRNKNVVVIGEGKFALSEAEELKRIVNSVTILTNGKEIKHNDYYEINTKKIKEIHGDMKVRQIEFEDGSKMDIDGIFIANGQAGGSDFAKKIGVVIQKDSIIVDENMQTNVEGLYSCGNSTGGLLQVCKAVYEGAKAGIAATNYIRQQDKQCDASNK